MVALPWFGNGFSVKDCRLCLLTSGFVRDGAISIGNERKGRPILIAAEEVQDTLDTISNHEKLAPLKNYRVTNKAETSSCSATNLVD